MMRTFYLAVGIISVITGLALIFTPELVRSVNERSRKTLSDMEGFVFRYRTGVGFSLLVSSVLFFFMAYYIKARGGFSLLPCW